MKPIVDLMDSSINKLKKIMLSEHGMICNSCGQVMDLRDFTQVAAHESCNGIPVDYEKVDQIPHTAAQKVGSSELHVRDIGTINLN